MYGSTREVIEDLLDALRKCRDVMPNESPLWNVTQDDFDFIKANADRVIASVELLPEE